MGLSKKKGHSTVGKKKKFDKLRKKRKMNQANSKHKNKYATSDGNPKVKNNYVNLESMMDDNMTEKQFLFITDICDTLNLDVPDIKSKLEASLFIQKYLDSYNITRQMNILGDELP